MPYVDGVLYSISGYTRVGEDVGGDAANPRANQRSATLTIEPGVTIFGSSGQDALVINRGSRINAVGEKTKPIVFTSRQSVEGTTNVDSIGQWGGLVLLGRAPTANCIGSVTPGTAACEAEVEGVTGAYYGGNAPGDSTGTLKYVRVMHSGFEVLPNVELNGITLAGLGSGTSIEYVQVHNSSDDGFEWFGGTVNNRYLVATGNDAWGGLSVPVTVSESPSSLTNVGAGGGAVGSAKWLLALAAAALALRCEASTRRKTESRHV